MEWSQNYYDQLIHKVDQFTRKYYVNQLIRGGLYFVGLITLVFILFNLLESYFYFGTAVRKILFFSFVFLSFGTLWYWIVRPMMHYFRLGKLISQEQAARIIGTHFSEVKDKLLNVLQLKAQAIGFSDRTLIEASINQKASELSPVPFVAAINLQKNKQYLRYALPPIFVLGAILLWAPSLIKDPTSRFVQNDKEFQKAAPFSFVFDFDNLKVEQNGDFKLNIDIEGSIMPSEVFIDADHFQYRLKQDDAGQFSYIFKNVQKDIPFRIFSGDVSSNTFVLKLLRKPILTNLQIRLEYPAYTGRKNENLSNTGDLIIPVGTKAVWFINTEHTENMKYGFSFGKGLSEPTQRAENEYQFSQRILQDGSYTLFLKNAELSYYDSIQYQINVIPDQYPQIQIESFEDSSDNKIIYYAGEAADDYGVRNLTFNYAIQHPNGKSESIKSVNVNFQAAKLSSFRYLLNLNEMDIKAGEKLNYYFEVWDNDGVHGSKSTKSSVMEYKLETLEELAKQEEKNNEDIKSSLEKSIADAKKLQEKLNDYKDKLHQKKDLEWQNKKDLEKMLKEQEAIEKQFEEAKKKFDENLKKQEQHSNPDENLLNKQQQLQKHFNDAMNNEMKQLMEKIQDLMQELNKDQAIQMSEQFQNQNQEMNKEMDRLLELFKNLELEKNIKDQINKLRELAEAQKELAEKTQQKSENQEELKKKQDDINKKFDEVKKGLEDIKKKNEELQTPKALEDRKAESEEIKNELNQSKEKLSKNENEGASKSQKKAGDKMEEMANDMDNEMNQSEQEQAEEDIKVLRQLLENLVNLSFEQEGLISAFGTTNPQAPKYVSLVQDEFRLKDNFRLIEDTLNELSKRVVQIESYISEKVQEINSNFSKTIDYLEDRQVSQASGNQHRIMKNVNDLAVMLSETMKNMQQQKNESCNKPGNKSCNKPKPGGKGKKGTKGKVPMDKISEGQKEMGEGMKGLKNKKDKGQGKLSEEFAQMAAKQAQLRKMLQDLEKEKREQGQGGNKQLQDIINEMNKTERELVNKQITNETLKRQQEITTRLLEAERSEREREFKEERKSETGMNIERKFPDGLEEYLKQRQAETEWFKHVSPDLRPFYKKLVEQYYQSLKKQG
ncbi:MAG: DUF4175 domain-containing protein [Bacteroidota bacterium]|nr:DUF4175 domain-containing protein [Bacteroidota bacterium]